MLPCLIAAAALAAPIEVAITVDDLPGNAAQLQAIRETLLAHKVPGVVGFANGFMLENSRTGMAAVRDWVGAGYRLGSHSFSHGHLEAMTAQAYCDDIDRNEPLLRDATGSDDAFRIFRYPYLEQGATAAQREAVRSHLQRRGYQVAEVTVDPYDFAWDKVFGRCLALGDQGALQEVHRGFVDDAVAQVLWADSVAQRAFGRGIKHIMLLHSRNITASYLDEILRALRARGVVFVPVAEAMADPVYATSLEVIVPTRGHFLSKVIRALKLGIPTSQRHPVEWMAAQCLTSEASAS